ncbi:GNAT family N-acetyltransferase [uncultured Mucilaginibacter sp.]|uniref:GNAT family N-acetyltransferase n=1 Tax=uncultured Mucilaginibacter sp. TaxID=797541 RepID=UPI0025FD81EC|nr:GNAT family N-acetyltransferase [uncultured Mucilaginibacter sp.]
MHIEQITPQLTWQLRRNVLYPNSMLWEMEMDEDNHGYHFGAFIDNQLIGVVSLFQQQDVWQFRKFAIDPAHQGKGIGRLLLQYISQFVQNEGGSRLWCNARLSAIEFYLKSGFIETGEYFSKNGFDYQILETSL